MRKSNARVLSLMALGLALVCFMASCKGSSDNGEKSASKRAEDYHKYLLTPDLALFELTGNVKTVIFPKGFLAQYVEGAPPTADTLAFEPDGQSYFSLVLNGDSLLPVRNMSGRIILLSDEREGGVTLEFTYLDDNRVKEWIWHDDIAVATYTFALQGGKVAMVTANGASTRKKMDIKILETDAVGNWVSRAVTYIDSKGKKSKSIQRRSISYY